jgi:hypothetical protein
MSIGYDGKTFYTYFVCRFDDREYKVSVPALTGDTPASVAKKLQDKADLIEREVLEGRLKEFAFFKGEDIRTICWTVTGREDDDI